MLDKKQRVMNKKLYRLVALIGVMLFLSACASNVVVKSDFPKPLVAKLALNGNLTFTEEFKNYTYLENKKERRSLRSIDLAEAQVSLFGNVFDSLINLVADEEPNKQINILPEVLDFQYTAPNETSLKQYEVWIKYRLKINNGVNQKIADWVVKGYGKTPTSLLSTGTAAFNSAARVALRDVGAQISTQFPKQDIVQKLIRGETVDVIAEEPPEPVLTKEVAQSDSQTDIPKGDKTEEAGDER